MRPVTVTVAGAGNSSPIPLDLYITPFELTLQISIVSGAINATVQYTNDDVFASGYDPATGNWFNHADLVNEVAAAIGTIISPVTAVRLVNADTGTARLRVTQAGSP